MVFGPNLLTLNQSSMEFDSNGWGLTRYPSNNGMYVVGLAGGSVPMAGSWCLELTSYGIPQMWGGFTTYDPNQPLGAGFGTVAATPGWKYWAQGYIRSYWASSYAYILIEWRNASGALLGGDGVGDTGMGAGGPFGGYFSGTNWVYGWVQGFAPAGTVYATVCMYVVESDGVHPTYLDDFSLSAEPAAPPPTPGLGVGIPIF